ncbi:hypothetical protein [Niastella sp. OAS944]|jgi:hypothetical protein|uniref:hypothetical protein n=1 Tax=Niastella sp. OAS944 TaxID=2664089 RepID=UPI00348EAB92|nr:hypothetical protein [Chitinophagaceae bacterium OAS944]
MNKSSIIIAVLTTLSFLAIIISYFNKRTDKDDYKLLRSNGQITKAELTIFSAPGIQEKKLIPLSDRKELDSLNMALIKQATPIKVEIAKENSVTAIINVYKNNEKTPVGILRSETTGWVLLMGNETCKSDYIFRLVQRYLPQ